MALAHTPLKRPIRLTIAFLITLVVSMVVFGCYRTTVLLVARTAASDAAARISKECVFTMDEVREDYLRDVKYAFQRGCYFGVDYPPEFKLPSNSFNQNSPVLYCARHYATFEEMTVAEDLSKLGRRK